jgi:hypothetical protein
MDTAPRYGVDDHGTRNTMPPTTRDFTGSDAPGKVINASRWRVFSTGLFFTVYMWIIADSGIVIKLYPRYKIYNIFILYTTL